MEYVLTEHAQNALEKRKIQLRWMEKALQMPLWIEKDRIDDDLEHRLAPIPEYGNRVLRVIVNVRKIPPYIVTVYFDKRRTNE